MKSLKALYVHLLITHMKSLQIRFIQQQAKREARKSAEAFRDRFYVRQNGGVAIA